MNIKAIVGSSLVLALVATATPVSAQIGIGPIAGVSLANVHGADTDITGLNRGNRTGFLIGGVVDFPVGGIISIRPEVFYVQKGVRYSDSSGEVGFNLDYFEIPVLLVVGIPTGGSVTPELFLGPQVSFQTKCQLTATPAGGSSANVDCPSGSVETTDFGVLVGAGITLDMGFMAQVGFDFSLTTLDAEADPDDIKNKAIYALVGWMFRLN